MGPVSFYAIPMKRDDISSVIEGGWGKKVMLRLQISTFWPFRSTKFPFCFLDPDLFSVLTWICNHSFLICNFSRIYNYQMLTIQATVFFKCSDPDLVKLSPNLQLWLEYCMSKKSVHS